MSIFYKGKQIAGNEVTLSEVKKQTEQGINELENKKKSSLQDLENKKNTSLNDLSLKVEEAIGVAIGSYIDIASNSTYTPSGYLLRDGAEYSRTQFESFYDNWLISGLIKTITYTEYNNQINTNGFCDKFAVDTTNKKFRTPLANPTTRTLIEKKEPTELDPTWYNLYSDGWCEQGGHLGTASATSYTVTFLKEFVNTNYSLVATDSVGVETITDTGGASDTVFLGNCTTSSFYVSIASSRQQSSWEAKGYTNQVVEGTTRPYVVVANGELNESAMNWSQWATSLEGKANVDLTNVTFTQTLIDKFISWNMPDYNSGIAVTFPISGTEFIAPCDGIYVTNVYYNNRQSYLYINGVQAFMYYDHSDSIIQYPMYVPLQKGDTIYWSASLTNDFSIFYPLKGVN